MPLLNNELARREGPTIAAANRSMRINCELNDLPCADGFAIRCKFTASVRVGPTPADRVMLAEVLLADRISVTAAQIGEHFAAALAAPAARLAREQQAVHWLGTDGASAMLAALRKAGESIAFRAGLELLDPMSADLASPDYQKQQLFARQTKIAEQRAAEQISNLKRAGELLREFHSLRQSAPLLSPGAVLDRLSPADRGSILQSLLQASADGVAARLFAVAGPCLAEIDSGAWQAMPKLHTLSAALGPLRSVQSADIAGYRRLLVGARDGFFVLDPDDLPNAEPYGGLKQSTLGFSRVIHEPRTGFWATHAEWGLMNWAEGNTNDPKQVLAPIVLESFRPAIAASITYGASALTTTAAGPRNITALTDGSLLYSAGTNLYRFTDGKSEPIALPGATGANIVAIMSDDVATAAVFDDGSVWTPEASGGWTCRAQRGTAVCAVGRLPWLGASRLLLATINGPIDCIGLDDPLVTQYSSPGAPGCRAMAASSACVAAISRDRQRLLLWNSWDGARPVGEIYLGAQAHHRIADIAFA